MASDDNVYAPGPRPRTVRADGKVLDVPDGWTLVPPGDAGLTRRIKAAGVHWMVKEKKGRRTFSRGVWAPKTVVDAVQQKLAEERADPRYQKKLDAGRRRREKEQAKYALEFEHAVYRFLDFDRRYDGTAKAMAKAIAEHAVPVGSGTVARTQRIPIEKRAEAAVIAWMRHQTTAYDQMKVARIKGERRRVRRLLAEHSRLLLRRYRRGETILGSCPLRDALIGP